MVGSTVRARWREGLLRLKRHDTTTVAAGLAHLLAWAALLWLALWPGFYQGVQGVEVEAFGPWSRSGGTEASVSASLIHVNGWRVLPMLLLPVALTALGLFAVLTWDLSRGGARGGLWGLAALLVGFCLLGMFTVGVFYLPAALLLVASAIVASRRPVPLAGMGGVELAL